jgi:co-chaperonin GroES (HSP10)
MSYQSIKPIRDYILVTEMNFGERQLSSGLYLLSDDKKSQGIRPRWGKVFAIGPEQEDVKVGEWVLIEHGRWTRGVEVTIQEEKLVLRRIDNNAIMLVSDQQPSADDLLSEATVV